MERQAITKVQRKPSVVNHLQRQSARSARAAHPLSALQRSVGSQAVQRLIRSPYIQAKLQVSTPGDEFEQEADRVADTVMRMPGPQAGPGATVSSRTQISRLQRKCTECEGEVQRQPSEEEEEKQLQKQPAEEEQEEVLQRRAEGGGELQGSHGVQSQIDSLRGGGQPLPESARAYFEPRFGQDFSGVRIHTGSQAATAAKTINAQAFTVGKDVAFGAGQYSPETGAGKRLLAHELTHVAQQGGTTAIARDPGIELASNPITSVGTGNIQRDWIDDAEDVASDVSDWVGSAADSVSDTADDAGSWIEEKKEAASEFVEAVADSASNLIDENVPNINLESIGDQALSQVVTQTQQKKLPILQRAETLAEEARRILEANISPNLELNLPPATTGTSEAECCPTPTLQTLRSGLETPRNTVQNAINGLNDAEAGIQIACKEAKVRCLAALAAGALGSAALPSPGGTAAAVAGCFACILSAYPVATAIRVQAKAEKDLEVAIGGLERALSNHRTCFTGNSRCSDFSPPKAPTK